MANFYSNIIKSSTIRFIINKYIVYSVQFITSLFIAKQLGLFYFGVYGFSKLVLHYLPYTNLGVNYSFNVIVTTKSQIKKQDVMDYFSNSLLITLLCSLIVFFISISNQYFSVFPLGVKYNFEKYIYIVLGIYFLKQINLLFINLFRIYNKFGVINFAYFLPVFLEFIAIFYFVEHQLLLMILYFSFLSQFILIICNLISIPFSIKNRFNFSIIKQLINRGLMLLIYNASFYFILISARSIISYYNNVESFSLFTFAYNISEAIAMFTGAVGFLIYPKILNKYSKMENSQLLSFLNDVRVVYMTANCFLMIISIGIFPLVFLFLDGYSYSYNYLLILVICQLFIANTFGYTTLLIERNMEKELTYIGLQSILIILFSGNVIGIYFNGEVLLISIAVLAASIYYNYKVAILCNTITKEFSKKLDIITNILNYRVFVPIIFFIFSYYFFKSSFTSLIISLLCFILFNVSQLKFTIWTMKKIVFNNKTLTLDIINE